MAAPSSASKTQVESTHTQVRRALEYAHQAERLGGHRQKRGDVDTIADNAIEAKFITGQDAVIQTAAGDRLPAVPVDEARKLNELKDRMQGKEPLIRESVTSDIRLGKDGSLHGILSRSHNSPSEGNPLGDSTPPTHTNPLFPPIPIYGPPSLLRNVQCLLFRASAFVLSSCFLLVIVLGCAFTSVPSVLRNISSKLRFQDPHQGRPFYEEEKRRKLKRKEEDYVWSSQSQRRKRRLSGDDGQEQGEGSHEAFPPLERGPARVVCDAAYYARRVGLDIETFDVQTEDGFVIELWHVYDPNEQRRTRPDLRQAKSASIFREGFVEDGRQTGASGSQFPDGQKKYPVLLIHGLLQSGGAFCCNDDKSLAFFLAKSGYDVWIGNNRCGFEPRHSLLEYGDPRMWAWNIRHMGVMDLPALISRVLEETGFPQLGLVSHSQGTTQTFVALAKEQRPDIGEKISVFCALAPAVYAGPLISKIYLKIMRVITPAMFRLVFGIHAFIPLMHQAHKLLPSRLYSQLGYHVFSFLFDWTDERWERDLRDRMFQFSPSLVSAESMRWWLGREHFAAHKCILATRTEGRLEDEEDREDDDDDVDTSDSQTVAASHTHREGHNDHDRGRFAWYDQRCPPFAFWIAGNDNLVDGRRLLRRFDRGREPHVKLVHRNIIEGYEHLDVIWAMDAIDKVGKEVRTIIWRTAPLALRQTCRTPTNCD